MRRYGPDERDIGFNYAEVVEDALNRGYLHEPLNDEVGDYLDELREHILGEPINRGTALVFSKEDFSLIEIKNNAGHTVARWADDPAHRMEIGNGSVYIEGEEHDHYLIGCGIRENDDSYRSDLGHPLACLGMERGGDKEDYLELVGHFGAAPAGTAIAQAIVWPLEEDFWVVPFESGRVEWAEVPRHETGTSP